MKHARVISQVFDKVHRLYQVALRPETTCWPSYCLRAWCMELSLSLKTDPYVLHKYEVVATGGLEPPTPAL